jgi:AcrR family transcriptional regulator
MEMRSPNKNKPKLDAAAWLDAGLDALYEKGIEAVKVEPLAKRLGVTKGSFYWHFKDRRALLDGLVDRWVSVQSQAIKRIETAQTSPEETLEDVFRHITHKDSRHDVAMRTWARTDIRAAEAVAVLDAGRLAAVATQFVALGHSEAEARFRAHAVYYFQLGDQLVLGEASQNEREPFFERLRDMLLDE